MLYFARVAWTVLLGTAFADAACASTMGSLAPHEAAATANAQQQWIADPATNCRALDADFDDGDSISWQGRCVGGLASGAGVLSFLNKGRPLETITGAFGDGILLPGHVSAVWSDGSKYNGGQAGGEFDGAGIFLSATGDQINGEWKGGALNGKASVAWANGDRYDGDWKDGKSDGQGTEVWANGDRYEGLWKDGKPVGQNAAISGSAPLSGATAVTAQAVAAAPASSSPVTIPATTKLLQAATTAPAPETTGDTDDQALPLHDFMGKTLVAVDGSTIDLSQSEGGLARNITLPNGVAQQTSFAFMTGRIGTVSSQSATIGLFRRNGDEMDIDYTDGNIETMKPDTAGGLLQSAQSPDGATSCTAWYPQGHVFSQDERKAVQEYAARLGVAAAAAPKSRHTARSASHSCGGGFLISVAETQSPSASGAGLNNPSSAPAIDSISRQPSAETEKLLSSHNEASTGLLTIPVKTSAVHVIDAPYEPLTSQPSVEEAKFTAADMMPQIPPVSGDSPVARTPPPSSNASACLSVTSNGAYWGFQNRCANAVQFAYCEMNDANPLTSCHRTSVSGSVAANGFSALINDRSLSEQGVRHDFRWMACEGGAGELVPHLDAVDPPAGRCLRTVAAADGGGAS